MASWYFPRREADLRAWAVSFAARVSADPGRYALTAADAEAVAEVVGAFADRHALAANPATRTRGEVMAKDGAKADMIDVIRRCAGRVRAADGVSAADKVNLGLSPGRRAPVRVPAPSTYPLLTLSMPATLRLAVRVSDSGTPGRRARPAGAVGCQVFVTTAPDAPGPPAIGAAWHYAGLATRGSILLEFDTIDALTRARVTGRWQNGKGESGPWSPIQSLTFAAATPDTPATVVADPADAAGEG